MNECIQSLSDSMAALGGWLVIAFPNASESTRLMTWLGPSRRIAWSTEEAGSANPSAEELQTRSNFAVSNASDLITSITSLLSLDASSRPTRRNAAPGTCGRFRALATIS